MGPEELGLAIDRDGEVPIGLQLAWALRVRIGERQLEPGQRLPGLRDLAEQAGVNVNTVRAVYQRLQQEGLIETQQGSGSFVAARSRETSQVGVIAANAARRARQAGIDPREVAAALYVASEPLGETEQASAARRATLRTQITALEAALGEIEGAHPGLMPPREAVAAGDGPTLLDAAGLEQVRATLVRRLPTLQAFIDTLTADEPEDQDRQAASRRSPVRKRAQKRTTNPAPAGA
jgi:DNA-binding transcriptional regulator YhcF (GntR family)